MGVVRRIRSSRRGVVALGVLALAAASSNAAHAATSNTAAPFYINGGGNAVATTTTGDFVTGPSASGGMSGATKEYAYYIEVPASLPRLVVEIWDADVGNGGATETAATTPRDRTRNTYLSTATYTLTNPTGTVVATLSCATGQCTDNAWSTLYDTNSTGAARPNGHWKVSVTMSDDDVNAYGVRAHDGDSTAAGTELPIYADSYLGFGVNPNGGAVRTYTYTEYPYVTEGCTALHDTFSWDSDKSTGNSVALTPPLGTTQTTLNANLSTFAWKANAVATWTSANNNKGYGIWTGTFILSSLTAGGGNYAQFYFGNASVTAAPTTNPFPNVFREYLPTDGNGVPSKPYVSQYARASGNPHTPASGSSSAIGITVTVTNPTTQPIVFSATNLVTANIPATRVTYAGADGTTQGTITSQPAIGGTGNITWNPGTIAAGATASFAYAVRVIPTATGQTTSVTGTGVAGTTATYVDETGNTAQARATYTFGPLCGLSVTSGTATAATVANFKANDAGGNVTLSWDTASEADTVGFDIYREEDSTGRFVRVNDKMLLGNLDAPEGGSYKLVDPGGEVGHKYIVVETEPAGTKRVHGPFDVERTSYPGPTATPTAEKYARAMRRDASPRARLARVLRRTIPSGLAASVDVRDAGLYAVTSHDLALALGTSQLNIERRIRINQLALSNQGRSVPWAAADAGGKALYFYGEAIESPYSQDNVYRVQLGAGEAMQTHAVTAPKGPLAKSFWQSQHVEKDALAALAFAPDPEDDYWFWTYLYAGDAGTGSRTFDFDVTSKAPSTGQGITEDATVTVYLHGATTTGVANEHHVGVAVNGVSVGESSFTGIAPLAATFKFSSALLQPGRNQVELVGILDSGVSHSIVYVDSFDVAYAHTYTGDGAALDFQTSGAGSVAASGFASPKLRLVNVDNPGRPTRIVGAQVSHAGDGTYSLAFAQTAYQGRYLAVAADQLRTPSHVRADSGSTLRSPYNAADHIIVTTRELHDAALALARHRRSHGLRSVVVDVEDIYNEFSFGRVTPWAIHDFLAYAQARWAVTPRYVVLAGDGSYDYKDLLGHGRNLLPPILRRGEHGLFASDVAFAGASATDPLTLAVGRIPSATPQELTSYIDKLIAYESAAPTPTSANANIMMLAGADGATTHFADMSADLGALVADGHRVTHAGVSDMTLADARSTLFREVAAGTPVIHYIGHGGSDRLGAEGLLTVADVPSFTAPRGALPFITAMSCAVGRFELAGVQSLGEALLAQNGGAIAVWSPSGLSVDSEAQALSKIFFRIATLPETSRLPIGDLVAKSLVQFRDDGGDQQMLDIYNLLGDPATPLNLTRLPEPAQPMPSPSPSSGGETQ